MENMFLKSKSCIYSIRTELWFWIGSIGLDWMKLLSTLFTIRQTYSIVFVRKCAKNRYECFYFIRDPSKSRFSVTLMIVFLSFLTSKKKTLSTASRSANTNIFLIFRSVHERQWILFYTSSVTNESNKVISCLHGRESKPTVVFVVWSIMFFDTIFQKKIFGSCFCLLLSKMFFYRRLDFG